MAKKVMYEAFKSHGLSNKSLLPGIMSRHYPAPSTAILAPHIVHLAESGKQTETASENCPGNVKFCNVAEARQIGQESVTKFPNTF